MPQVAEEQRLRAEKLSAVEAARKRVRAEEEEEEARLMEAKADMLRKLKQQASAEAERPANPRARFISVLTLSAGFRA